VHTVSPQARTFGKRLWNAMVFILVIPFAILAFPLCCLHVQQLVQVRQCDEWRGSREDIDYWITSADFHNATSSDVMTALKQFKGEQQTNSSAAAGMLSSQSNMLSVLQGMLKEIGERQIQMDERQIQMDERQLQMDRRIAEIETQMKRRR